MISYFGWPVLRLIFIFGGFITNQNSPVDFSYGPVNGKGRTVAVLGDFLLKLEEEERKRRR